MAAVLVVRGTLCAVINCCRGKWINLKLLVGLYSNDVTHDARSVACIVINWLLVGKHFSNNLASL